MNKELIYHPGQYQARTRWHTHESGAAFDRKKTSYLTAQAQEFIAQQAFCVVAGLTADGWLDGILLLGRPGVVQVLDESTCLFQLENQGRTSHILRHLQYALSTGQPARLGLFFICHPTRERLCVHGTVEEISDVFLPQSDFLTAATSMVVRLHVREAFFHCSKYIRTHVAGLTVPKPSSTHQKNILFSQHLFKWNRNALSKEHCRFLSEQQLCFLCTMSREGQCAVNHRGGTAGLLAAFLPNRIVPGGVVLVPDFKGNGAFEAIGNIFETGQAALVVPDYAAQMALCVAGTAYVTEPKELPEEMRQHYVGAERIIALSVRHIEIQSGDWSATLAYERDRAASIWAANETAPDACLLK